MSAGGPEPRDPRAPPESIARSHRRTSTARGRRGRGLASVADLVSRVLRNEPDDAVLFRVMAAWERALPHRIVKNARPVALKKGVLYVAATTSAWAQEITLRATDVLGKIRSAAPRVAITSMRVRAGRLPERIIPPPRPSRRVVPLAKLPDVLVVPLENVADERLRAAFDAAIRTSLGRVIEEPDERGS